MQVPRTLLTAIIGLILVGLIGCEKAHMSPDDLPPAIRDYITTNYPDASIEEAEQEDEDGFCYEVELDDGTELYFDCDNKFVRSEMDDDEAEEIEFSELPQAAQDYITQNYPGVEVEEVEKKEGEVCYEVELENGLEVTFDCNGKFLNAEED